MRVLVLLLALFRGTSACHGPYLHIFGAEQNYDSFIAQYGDVITILCSGTNSKNLKIEHQTYMDTSVRQTEIVNITTIGLIEDQLEIESHEYTCVDEESTRAARLIVNVRPVITILSPNVHYKRIGNEVNYIVPVGEDYEVLCSGNSELSIRKDGRILPTVRVNGTAVITTKQHEKEQVQLWYECEHELGYGGASLKVAFDYPPAPSNFWCVEYEFQINCYWSVLSQYATFTLFYEDEDGIRMRLYEDHIGTKKNRSCEWSMDDVWNRGLKIGENLSLVMQSCNPIFCLNETYNFNMDRIKKSDPPVDLKLLKTWPQTAVVSWKEFDTTFKDHFGRSIEYKAAYQLPGAPERELKASSIRVNCFFESKGSSTYVCEGKIDLPCPGKLYIIKVFRKRANTPRTSDGYWSEPASITLRTNPAYSLDEGDPICDEGPELSELRDELKSTERKLALIKRVCEDKKIEACSNTLESVCLELNNTVLKLGRD